jgi:hypothetical protein
MRRTREEKRKGKRDEVETRVMRRASEEMIGGVRRTMEVAAMILELTECSEGRIEEARREDEEEDGEGEGSEESDR